MEESASLFNPSELTYDDRGLIPAVLQQKGDGKVIMLGYMSEETLNETIRIGQEYLRNVADWPRNLSSIFGALTYHGGPIQYKSEGGAKVIKHSILWGYAYGDFGIIRPKVHERGAGRQHRSLCQ